MGPLAQVLESTSELLISLIASGSYPAIFTLMALESALVPIPSELVMPFSGFLVARGEMSLWGVVAAGVLGNLAGSGAAYVLGRALGWDRLVALARRLPRGGRELERADDFFRRWGRQAVLLGRMMPAVRTFISLPAGMSGVPAGEFLILTALGSIPWNLALVWAGIVLEENWGVVREFTDLLALIILISAALYLISGGGRGKGSSEAGGGETG